MTTTIQSGAVSYTHGISVGQIVKVSEPPIRGLVTYISFGKRSIRGCVQYTDKNGNAQERWDDLDDMTPVED